VPQFVLAQREAAPAVPVEDVGEPVGLEPAQDQPVAAGPRLGLQHGVEDGLDSRPGTAASRAISESRRTPTRLVLVSAIGLASIPDSCSHSSPASSPKPEPA